MAAYDLRVYHVAAGELETLARILQELALPMMPDYGIRAVGFWTEPTANTLYQLSEHDCAEDIGPDWDRFHADPRWPAGLAKHRGERKVVLEVRTTILSAILGTPPLAAGTKA